MHSIDFDRLDIDELANAVIFVDDVIARLKFFEAFEDCGVFES